MGQNFGTLVEENRNSITKTVELRLHYLQTSSYLDLFNQLPLQEIVGVVMLHMAL